MQAHFCLITADLWQQYDLLRELSSILMSFIVRFIRRKLVRTGSHLPEALLKLGAIKRCLEAF